MATKQPTDRDDRVGIAHATVVPSNYRPGGDATEGTGTDGTDPVADDDA